MERQWQQQNPKPGTEISSKPWGHLHVPLLLKVDTRLIVFLNTVQKRRGVVNCHVVRAAAKALIESAESGTVRQNLNKIDLPHTWVQSIYRCMKFNRRIATTSRPQYHGTVQWMSKPFPSLCWFKKSSNTRYHQSLCSTLIGRLHHMYQWADQPWL